MNTLQTLPNLLTYSQVEQVIHLFYQQLLTHPQLAPYFTHIEDISAHEQRIVKFWWLALGGRLPQPPKIDMIGKHMSLGIHHDDLSVWLNILHSTLSNHVTPTQAQQWHDKAKQIAERLKAIVIDQQTGGIQITEPDNASMQ